MLLLHVDISFAVFTIFVSYQGRLIFQQNQRFAMNITTKKIFTIIYVLLICYIIISHSLRLISTWLQYESSCFAF